LREAQVFREYFKELEEESIRDNFVIIYELFDEIMDFGYPQTTETKILQEYAPLASGIALSSWLWTRRSPWSLSLAWPDVQIHHARVAQADG
jgi:hypothetical protein